MLLAPFALFLLSLGVPIVLMYLLKLRRQEQRVPSTFLWKQVMQDVQANAPWQRLRFNLLLLLQLLALAAIIFAIAKPAYSQSHALATDVVVIVDESYGMQAHDVQPSRFAAALGRANSLASELAGGHAMSVIGMGATPKLEIADSADKGSISAAINRLRVGIGQPNFLEALSLAASLARSGQDTRLIVLTSRDSGISSLPLPVSFPVDIVRLGGSLRDLAITNFRAASTSSGVRAVARVSNFGSRRETSDLNLYVNGHLGDVRSLTIGAHGQQNLFWTDLPTNAGRLEIRLSAKDDMSTDKSAWAVVPGSQTRRVLLVSSGNYFLEAALADLPGVGITALPPAAYRSGMESAYDLAIFDGTLPPGMPVSSALFVSPPRGRIGALRFKGTEPGGQLVASPGLTGPPASILRYADVSDVRVAQTRIASFPGWMQTLATAGGHDALAAGSQGSIRLAVINFNLQHSDWPLRISFPVALENLVPYLAPGLALGTSNVTSGQRVRFLPPPATKEIEVAQPDGSIARVDPPFPPFTATARSGLYTATAVKSSLKSSPTSSPTRTASFAVNFFPARPGPASGPSVLHSGQAAPGRTLLSSVPITLVWLFEALALSLLAVEWWVSFRGAALR